MLTWIVGSGGLLGSALVKQTTNLFQAPTFSWGEPELLRSEFDTAIRKFKEQVHTNEWCVIWAAGSATTSTSEVETAKELAAFTYFTQALTANAPENRGAFFLSSSAGGVYAGSTNPPFSMKTEPAALSAYGELKIAQEKQAISALDGKCDVLIGRIANLYGPSQNLEKLQGLISRLALSAITKEPITMFVSLDTMRDYIYTDDAARVIHSKIRQAMNHPRPAHSTSIIASGQATSLGYLINMMQDVAHTKIPVAYGNHASSGAQAHDLRLVPDDLDLTERLVKTTLSAGVKNVYLDILNRYQVASSGR